MGRGRVVASQIYTALALCDEIERGRTLRPIVRGVVLIALVVKPILGISHPQPSIEMAQGSRWPSMMQERTTQEPKAFAAVGDEVWIDRSGID
jgi:hypothetical protein